MSKLHVLEGAFLFYSVYVFYIRPLGLLLCCVLFAQRNDDDDTIGVCMAMTTSTAPLSRQRVAAVHSQGVVSTPSDFTICSDIRYTMNIWLYTVVAQVIGPVVMRCRSRQLNQVRAVLSIYFNSIWDVRALDFCFQRSAVNEVLLQRLCSYLHFTNS